MPMYNYTARDISGNVKTDMLEAPNDQALVEKLQGQGLFIIRFSEALEMVQTQTVKTKTNLTFKHNKVQIEDLIVFSRQLATMLEAGVPLMRSLDVTLGQIQSKELYEIVKQIRADVEAGKSLSQSLARHKKVFGQFWVSLVEVGEASGTLSTVLNKLADHVEEDAEFRSAIISAVIYPAVLVVASIGAVVFFALFVAPRFEEIFTSMKAQLPFMTVVLLTVFKFIKVNFLYIAATGVIVYFLLLNYCKTPFGRIQFEQFMFSLPVVGDVTRLIIMERFASQMAILIGAGVPILLSLEIVQRLVENESSALLIGKVREGVKEGKSVAECMSKEEFFPAMSVQMIKVGEETGELAKMLNHVAVYYKRHIQTFLRRFGAIFEPFMLVFMAGVIGVIVVAVFLPLFQLGQGSKGIH